MKTESRRGGCDVRTHVAINPSGSCDVALKPILEPTLQETVDALEESQADAEKPMDCERWALFLLLLWPSEFAVRPRPRDPARLEEPGTEAKIRRMAERIENKEGLHHPDDLQLDAHDRIARQVSNGRNGREIPGELQLVGRTEPDPEKPRNWVVTYKEKDGKAEARFETLAHAREFAKEYRAVRSIRFDEAYLEDEEEFLSPAECVAKWCAERRRKEAA